MRAPAPPGPEPDSAIKMQRFTGSARYHRLSSGSGFSEDENENENGYDDSTDLDLDLDPDLDKNVDGYDEGGDAHDYLVRKTVPHNDYSKKPLALAVPSSERRFFFQRSRSASIYDPRAVATQPSVFDDPHTLEEYRPSDSWENIHRFDPDERWTWGEEHALIKKIDRRIMLFAGFMFMALELDRSNVAQALTDGLLEDLEMGTNGES